MSDIGKNPAFQFYPSDWLTDVELQSASASTRGIWINAMCRMWHSRERGSITLAVADMPRIFNANLDECNAFVTQMYGLGFADIIKNADGTLTISNRRMLRDEAERASTRKRVAKYRDVTPMKRSCNKNVTPPSSSSSSSSTSKTHIKACAREELPPTKDPSWWDDYSAEAKLFAEAVFFAFKGYLPPGATFEIADFAAAERAVKKGRHIGHTAEEIVAEFQKRHTFLKFENLLATIADNGYKDRTSPGWTWPAGDNDGERGGRSGTADSSARIAAEWAEGKA